MARTKVKMIDDSKPEAEEPKKARAEKAVEVEAKARKGQTDDLVERLKAELGELPKSAKNQSKEEKLAEKAEVLEEKAEAKEEKPKQTPKVGKEKPRSKKYKEAAKEVDQNTTYPLTEAVDLAKKVSYSKYDGTLEIHLNTALKNLRGSVALPYASAKKRVVLAFGTGAKEAGTDIIGSDEVLAEIAKGKVNFDILITTPEWMPKLAALAKVLGPKGLMPNPKNGTITDNLKEAIAETQTGKVEYKTEPNNKVMHLSLGKVSQPTEELSQNVKVLIQTIGKTKVKKAVLSPTLGPGVKLDLSSI